VGEDLAAAVEPLEDEPFPAKRDLPRRGRALEERQEKALAGQQLPLETAEKASLHPRIHLDAVGHEGHRARFALAVAGMAQTPAEL
jgi:hypothetical protein